MTSGPFRISAPRLADTRLQRDKQLSFTFNGKSLEGYAGDSLASALLANGVRVVGRSFKFHRPRGIFSCGFEEPNSLVQIGTGARTVPSLRSPLVELHNGLDAAVASGWPNLDFDLLRVLDFTAPLWAAGFYNKTFIWPNWHSYEWLMRRMAGFGHAPDDRDPDRYEPRNLHCETLVIGGGGAGLRGATAAAQTGARVVLVENTAELGGRAGWDGATIDGMAGGAWAQAAEEQLGQAIDVKILRRTMAVGCYEGNVVTLLESIPVHEQTQGKPRERFWIVRAKEIVVATGAIEQPLIFSNNDRPGIMLAGAAHRYLRRYSVAIGRRVVVATNNDTAYALARDLKDAGVDIPAIADTRHEVPQALIDEMRALSIPLLAGSIPVDTSGFGGLTGVSIGRLSRDGKSVESVQRFACDALAQSGGWNPNLHLYSQAGGRLIYNERAGAFQPAASHPVMTPVGGAASLDVGTVGARVSPVGKTHRQWVDLRHDVTVADLELAQRENYRSIEHVKRYTTAGMAADQGKTSQVAVAEIVARLRGAPASEIGHTTLRPPFTPVTLGAIVGRATGEYFAPSRVMPMHDWHAANGAVFEDFGEWKRPAVYAKPGESRRDSIAREARMVRSSAGLFDGSPLGKFEIRGPDALAFLDRFYINNLMTLKPWRARYGLMLRESGILFDDGTVVMIAPDHLVVTTTSGNANRVVAWLEEWHQCEWPHFRIALMPVTDQWANVTLTGPRAREILSQLDTDIDLANASFPHLEMREGRLMGYPARIYRVSFTGELTYEINVPAAVGQSVWDALLEKGKPHGMQAFGIDSLQLMRLEKGFLHLGSDTDGTTVPDDVGWGKVAANKKADFVGKRSLVLPENARTDRLQLIGLTSESDIPIGGHLRLKNSQEATDGWVTSAGRATLSGEPIALAMLRAGRQKIDADVSVHYSGAITRARVVNPPFFDPKGDRMNG